jgi:hypothetical protein
VFGKSTSGSGTGVYGEGAFFGAQFVTDSTSGGTAAGVMGKTNGPNTGVWGESQGGGTGVHGIGKTGGSFQGGSNSDGVGVVGDAPGPGKGVRGTASSGGVGVSGYAPAGGYAGQFEGDVDVQGYLRLKVVSSAPPAGDCSAVQHVGRVVVYNNPSYPPAGRSGFYVCGGGGGLFGWYLIVP